MLIVLAIEKRGVVHSINRMFDIKYRATHIGLVERQYEAIPDEFRIDG